MTSDLKILFMGTPEFAVHILDRILKQKYNVVGVVSVPDKPAGRGQKLHESAVTKYAKENNLNLLQPKRLKAPDFIEKLEALNIDIAVVVAFRMLPKIVWQMPRLGTFNLHASLLPQYRGAAPINWAIINGESTSGVTTFFIDEKIDTGKILLKKEVDIMPDDNAGDLHDKLMEEGAQLVIKTLEGLAYNRLEPQPQSTNVELKEAPKIFKDDCKINWQNSLEEIHNFIRGMSPYPTAWTVLKNDSEDKLLKVYKAQIQYCSQNAMPRKVIQKDGKLGITHKDGIIWLEEIQLAGKRRMNAKDFLNGYDLSDDAKVLS